MKTKRTRRWIWLLCAAMAATPAIGLAASPKAKPKPGPVGECTPKHGVKSEERRERCVLAVYARQCRVDEAGLYDAIARALDVKPREVWMTMGREVHVTLDRGGPCARGKEERHRLAEIAIEHEEEENEAEERQKTESPKEWLLDQLGGPNRVIDPLAVGRAFEERAALLPGVAKRAGLPVPTVPGWTNLTGFSQSEGRVNHILFPSAASSTSLLAGADGGGIWRSTDSGASWTPNNDFFGSLSIANFAKASNDNLTIYAATNPRGSHTYFPFGIAKSTDGGANWAQIASTNPGTFSDFEYVTRVAVHPTNSSTVLAATEHGAYFSTTGGTSWTKVAGLSTAARFVAFHPTDGNRMAIGYDDGTVRYTTTGDILGAGAATSTVLLGARYTKIAYAKSDATIMYALVSDSSTGHTRLYRSATSGASWSEITSLPAVGPGMYNSNYLYYTGGLWVDPLNANRLGLFEAWAFFTPDVTQPTPTWKSLASGWVDMHGMVEDPAYDGVTNKTVYVMDDGGLYRTTDIDNLDQFASFTRLDTGMTVTEVYSVAGRGGNPVLGAQDVGPRVWKTDPSIGDSTTRWRFMKGNGCPTCNWIGDGMTAAASTSNPNVLYGSRQYLDMIRSTDGGATAVSIVKNSALIDGQGATVANTNASFLAPFVLDPSNPSRMYAGGLSIWRSDNVDTGNPPTWTEVRGHYFDSACGADMPAGVIAVAPSNPDIVWVVFSCTGHVFKTANATTGAPPTWTEVTTMPAAATGRYKSSIMIDRYDPNVVWIGLSNFQSNTLFKTTDGGATPGAWTTVAGIPGAPIWSLVQHPASPSWLYAGTSVGLFASADGGATWSASNDGPANVVVRSLAWNTIGPVSELLVGTFGRGAWKAPIGVARTDLGADGKSDLIYRNTSTGQIYRMFMNGFSVTNAAFAYTEPNTAWKVVADADFNGDGVSDLLWRNSATGQVFLMPFAANGMPNGGAVIYTEPNAAWKIVATPDFDGDGKSDILWWNSVTGQLYGMLVNGLTLGAQALFYTEPNTNWQIVASGDFAGTGKRNQLVWRNATTGQVYLMTVSVSNGVFSQTGAMIYQEPNTAWKIIGAPDLNGDGKSDLLWRNDATGQVYGMLMNNGTIAGQAMLYSEANLAWKIVAQGDYNGDGKSDLLYRNDSTGQLYMILMNGLVAGAQAIVYTEPNLSWHLLGPYEYAQ